MKFLLDESVPLSLRAVLEKQGFDVEDVAGQGLRGADDAAVASHAKKQNALLVTRDLEFGSPLLYPKGSHYGCIILRFPCEFTAQHLARVFDGFLRATSADHLIGAVTIVELGRFRIRRFSNGSE